MSVRITFEAVEVDNQIDQAASEAAASAAIARAIADRTNYREQIVTAVAALFEQFKGQAIKMPTLGAMVATALNAQPENHSLVADRVQEYVRANSQGKTVDNVQERPNSLFFVQKGAGGGVRLRADMPAKPTE